MENVATSALSQRIALKDEGDGFYSVIHVKNQKTIIGIMRYEPEPEEDKQAYFVLQEEIGAASLLCTDDLIEEFETLEKAYDLAEQRILAFAKYITG